MLTIGTKLLKAEGGMVLFRCPGCNVAHQVGVEPPATLIWGWNGSGDAPTFTPSVLVRRETWVPPVTPENIKEWREKPWPQTKQQNVCHSFVTDGRIQFLTDCTHALAGQTVDLPDWPQ